MWKLSGKMHILDLGSDFFLFKFNNSLDYKFALLEGPWFIGGHHLSLRRWKPDFKPSEASMNTTVIWARLPELPLEYFDKTVLEKVGAKIGRLIKVDATTEHVLRGKFSRVCVEVSTDKPLVPLVKIGRVLQKVEYEGISMICFNCVKMPHKKDKCPLIVQDSTPNTNTFNNAGAPKTVNLEDNYGTWMIVEKKKNKNKGKHPSSQDRKPNSSISGVSNRFASLAEQNVMEKNERGSEEAFNAKIDNNNSHINDVSGGNDKRLESQLQTREMKGFNGSSTNDELLQVNQGRNLNRKNNSFNKSDGGCVKTAIPVIMNDPLNKGKDKLDSSTFLRNRGVDGGQQSITTISFTRNIGAHGGQHSVPTNSFSGLSKTIGGFLDSGRIVSSKSPSRTSGDGKSSDKNCD
ncbi:uncharacterized protein LOC113316497 [Papaver somniferum]|uniref:uncharacterized protein LOC113316497 n=1 Tax=Papaver somniferum TaxID=3469 RepID=UPI000E6FCD32|nr:uncharacterized protein LOC113316497 [Papaver somniferum]